MIERTSGSVKREQMKNPLPLPWRERAGVRGKGTFPVPVEAGCAAACVVGAVTLRDHSCSNGFPRARGA